MGIFDNIIASGRESRLEMEADRDLPAAVLPEEYEDFILDLPAEVRENVDRLKTIFKNDSQPILNYLDDIKAHFADDWIMLVYRPDSISYAWWFEAGGFNINYPNYDVYKDSIGMLNEIQQQNQNLLTWSIKENISWHSFTPTWVNDTFGVQLDFESKWSDILVSVYKP